MEEMNDVLGNILELEGFTRISAGESKSIFLGASKDIIQINSGKDKIYNELLDQVMDSINHDSTIMLTKRPTENAVADVVDVSERGIKSESNTAEKKAGRKSNVVVTYSDMEQDRLKIAESDNPRDKVKLKVIERISNEFDEKIKEAEANGKTLEVQNLKNKKNIAWSVVKDEIDGVKKPREEIKKIVERADNVTPESTYVAGYEPWADEHVEKLGTVIKSVLDSDDKYVDVEDFKLRSNISTNAYNSYNGDLKNFMELQENGEKYYAYDIETIGNALKSDRFSMVEFAAQGYKKDDSGKFVIDEADKFTALIEMMPEEQKEMRQIIDKLKADPQAINGLNDYERRSIVDLMRYSTVDHDVDKLKKELVHNPIIAEAYSKNEKILTEHIIANIETMVGHMESGLESLTYREGKENVVIRATEAQDKINLLFSENKDAAFVGHNSKQFDDVKLKEWHSKDAVKKFENKIELPQKRIDFMNLVQAVYPDARELLTQLWVQSGQDISKGIHYEQGHTRLYEFQHALKLLTKTKHSALADVADEGLGGILASSMDVITKDIQMGKLPTTLKGVQKNKGKILWSDTFLSEGQVLYANDGHMNYKKLEGMNPGQIDPDYVKLEDLDTSKVDLSFMAKFNEETGEFEKITNDFNTSVINSKSFYTVQGIQELDNGMTALRLYDKEQDKYSFIVREGENALEQIEDFVQRKFFDWNSRETESKERITANRKKDLARRRYDKMFSLSSSDLGRSTGFQSATRYYEALDIFNKRIEGKNLDVKKQARLNVLENVGKKVKPKQLEKMIYEEEGRLRADRMSHVQFEKEMKTKFMTLWDDKKSEWVFNEQEYKDFFQMRKRLESEREVYVPALEAIKKEYSAEFEVAKKRVDEATYGTEEFTKAKESFGKIARKMDMAWIAYTNDVEQHAPELNKQVDQELEPHQKRQVKVMDNGKERTLNFFDYEDAKDSINKYAYSGLSHIENTESRQNMARERLFELVTEMKRSGTINGEVYSNALQEITNNQVTGNAVTGVSKIFSETTGKQVKFMKELKVPIMDEYDVGLNAGPDRLKVLAEQHVEFSKTYLDFGDAPKTSKNKFIFNPQMEKLFDTLDNASRPFVLETNNRKAVEQLISSIQEHAPNHTLGFSWNKETNNLTVSVVKDAMNNTVVLRELQEGKVPTGALNFHVPLIGASGTHQIGNRVLNARSYLEYNYETGGTVRKSSTEKIVEEYTGNMKSLMSQMKYSSVNHAQETTGMLLNRVSSNLAGIQRGTVSYNDSNFFTNNLSDYIKQSQVDVQDVLIKQLLAGKFGETVKLTPDDFNDKTKIVNGQFKGLATFEDLNFGSQYKTALALEKFIEQNEFDLHVSGMKDDANAGKKLSGIDVRLLGAFRDFISQTRSNSIQAANGVILNEDVVSKLNDIGKKGPYVSTHQHVTTDLQKEFLDHWNSMSDGEGNALNEGKALSFDMKVMYMNDVDVFDRLQYMANDEEMSKILIEEGIAQTDESGKIMRADNGEALFHASAVPRVYEQQIIINKDVVEALKGKQTKTFHNVTNFSKSFASILKGENKFITLAEGDLIGRDADGKAVRWESSKKAVFSIDNGKIVGGWDEDLFKLQVGGEKGTVNPFSSRFMTAFTGSEQVVAIMNPNVEKHLDLGMLYESKAGLITQKAREYLLADNKTKLAELNEDALKLGLEWDEKDSQYIERVRKHFADKDLDVKDFNKIAAKHNIESSITHTTFALGEESLHRIDALKAETVDYESQIKQIDLDAKKLKQERTSIEKGKNKLLTGEGALNRLAQIDKEITSMEAKKISITKNIEANAESMKMISSSNKKSFEVGILNTVASAVYDYSRATDGTGKEILGFKKVIEHVLDEEGNEIEREVDRPIYAETKGNRGVAWGHRELTALRQKGLNETADRMIKQMILQGGSEEMIDESGRVTKTMHLTNNGNVITRIQEAHNLIESLHQMTNIEQEALAINIMEGGDVNSLPEYRSDIHTLKNTIFDKEHILSKMGGASANQHGYWLELPTAKLDNGDKYSIALNIHGMNQDGSGEKERVNSNKVFIPFTNLEGADGKVHFRELQKNINDIYRRAKDVEKAETGEEKQDAMKKLQKAVDTYTERLIYDVTSSKGFIGTTVGKVKMGFTDADGATSSATGLFKLIDPITSATQLDGETTFISEEMAKKMGVLNQLKDGGHVFTMNNRFPTFHPDAMQVTKLKLGKNIVGNEIHTSAFFSDLLAADSDGDYNNLVVGTSEQIQSEWEDVYKKEQQKHNEEMEALKRGEIPKTKRNGFGIEVFDEKTGRVVGVKEGKPATGNRSFDIETLSNNLINQSKEKIAAQLGKTVEEIEATNPALFAPGRIMSRNTADEIAAKIGKQTIGMASNLNLQMQQVAKNYLQNERELQESMFKVGQVLEQKLISSKHGVTVGSGMSPAMELISLIKKSSSGEGARDEAIRHMNKYFSDLKLGDDFGKALDGIRLASERSSKGINNPAMRAGTSRGIDPRQGVQFTLDNIMGAVEQEDLLTSNSHINILRHIEVEAGRLNPNDMPEEYRLSEEHVKAEEHVPIQKENLRTNTRQAAEGMIEKSKNMMSDASEYLAKNPIAKKGLIGGGVALGGFGLYNIASQENPIPEMNQQSQESPERENYNARPSRSPLPKIEDSGGYNNSQAVNVRVSAQGSQSLNKGQAGGTVSNSLNNSGVNSSGANMHITQRDSSKNLNSIWYRDKVQENV